MSNNSLFNNNYKTALLLFFFVNLQIGASQTDDSRHGVPPLSINKRPMSNKFKDGKSPFIIAGPCSIESREQLQSIVTSFSADPKIRLIRGGVWKPRTRPGGFEGIGEPALRWMRDLQDAYPGTQFCCEVARPEHVELCLRYGITHVWIGARTSGDPFSVGELTESLRGTNMSVLVKNPTSPDVRLWLGAIERVMSAGIESVAAIHRGFYVYNDSIPYRNRPFWSIPIELKRLMPELPILCDPSHIGGKREFLLEIMQTASDFGTDGYFIEVHPNPDEALTDADQQVTPQHLNDLLGRIVQRSNEPESDDRLEELRKQIDNIDDIIIQALDDRMHVSQQIAQVKADHNLTVFQPKRWEMLLERRCAEAKAKDLSEEFVKGIFERIHAESVRVQEMLYEKK